MLCCSCRYHKEVGKKAAGKQGENGVRREAKETKRGSSGSSSTFFEKADLMSK